MLRAAIENEVADGTKELIAVVDGHRESEFSWKEVLLSLRAGELIHAPELAVGDRAPGFGKTLRLLTFFDFPAENWYHIHTTNLIESTFATIRLRHRKTKRNGSAKASVTMMFRLAQSASKNVKTLRSH